jgi:hypothetical protein
MEASCQGTYCSLSIMKRRYSLAAFGYFEYLKIIIGNTRFSSRFLPSTPAGKYACWMSLASSCIFGSCDVLAA